MVKKSNTFRKRLKQVGMEKEFTMWMKKDALFKVFKLGDKVHVIGGNYSITKVGSEGIIKDISKTYGIQVDFYKIPNSSRTGFSYIEKEHLELI